VYNSFHVHERVRAAAPGAYCRAIEDVRHGLGNTPYGFEELFIRAIREIIHGLRPNIDPNLRNHRSDQEACHRIKQLATRNPKGVSAHTAEGN
jgi:hypothetical protein